MEIGEGGGGFAGGERVPNFVGPEGKGVLPSPQRTLILLFLSEKVEEEANQPPFQPSTFYKKVKEFLNSFSF